MTHVLSSAHLATAIPHLAGTLAGGPVLKAHPIDYLIMGVYFVFVIAIGVITGRGHQTSEYFFSFRQAHSGMDYGAGVYFRQPGGFGSHGHVPAGL